MRCLFISLELLWMRRYFYLRCLYAENAQILDSVHRSCNYTRNTRAHALRLLLMSLSLYSIAPFFFSKSRLVFKRSRDIRTYLGKQRSDRRCPSLLLFVRASVVICPRVLIVICSLMLLARGLKN